MASNYVEYHMQLVNKRTGRPIDDDSGLFTVLTASDPTVQTVYSDDRGTSLTLPGTMTDGVIQFWIDSSVTSVDISVLTNAGRSYFLEGITISDHRVDVDPERDHFMFVVPWNGNTACDAVADTGFDLVVGMRVKDIFIHVTTVTTATGLDVGISGDTDGFVDAGITSTTGFYQYNANMTSNESSTFQIVQNTQQRGTLLVTFATGFTATATIGGSRGMWAREYYITTAATSLVYVIKETNSGGTGEGYIYLEYDLLRTAGN